LRRNGATCITGPTGSVCRSKSTRSAIREFARLIKAAGVRRIKFHGLRHTVATLMLSAGVPAHVVQRRLGHSKVEMTLGIYAHVLPSMQQYAAAKLAALLHG
jgi:integrase